MLPLALPLLEEAAGAEVEGRVATSPNAYDDIVAELERGDYDEIILETLPSHVSHWLHVDLPERDGPPRLSAHDRHRDPRGRRRRGVESARAESGWWIGSPAWSVITGCRPCTS